jgi:hypothetical protein
MYYSLLTDFTSRIFHREGICKIVRYREIDSGIASTDASFMDCIETKEKTSPGVIEAVINTFENDGTDLQNARGQVCDNKENMPGM